MRRAAPGQWHAHTWEAGRGIVRLQEPEGVQTSAALGINEAGVIVGYCSRGIDGGDWQPVIWTWPVRQANIDLKPGKCPNIINLTSRGKVAIAILGERDFDLAAVDASSLRAAGAGVVVQHNRRPQARLADVNGDGFMDLVAHFAVQDLQLGPSDDRVVLTGTMADGTTLEGTDTVVCRRAR